MADVQQILDHFVRLHANRVPKPTKKSEAVAYLANHSAIMPLTIPLDPYSRDEIAVKFDTTDTTVRWTLTQLSTFDPRTQSMIGLIFDDGAIHAHVVQRGSRMEDDNKKKESDGDETSQTPPL